MLALGDSEYANYCGFGRRLGEWLHAHGAAPLFDLVEVDNGDPAALRHWQHHLGLLAGRSDLPDWQAPAYQSWRLAAREQLNPQSQGGPCYLLTLTPPTGTTGSSTMNAKLVFTPSASQFGQSYSVIVVFNSQTGQATRSFTLQVPANRTPVVGAMKAETIECIEGRHNVELSSFVSDPDGQLLNVTWKVDGVVQKTQPNVP